MADLCACGAPIVQPAGPGRRRTACVACKPARAVRRVPGAGEVLVAGRVVSLPDRPAPVSGVHPFVESTRRKVEAAGMVDEPEGAHVLLLAEQMAAGGGTQAGLAALSNAYAKALVAIKANVVADADVIDVIFQAEA